MIMASYKLSQGSFVIREDERGIWWIANDPANSDWNEYLRWLEEGNEPLPADEPEAE